MARLSVAAVLVAAACDKGSSTRLYTDDEVAALEAKARPHADPGASGLPAVTALSLQPLSATLDAIRKEPDASIAARQAVAQIQWVRDLAKDERTDVGLYVVQSGEWMIADALDELLRSGRLKPSDLDTLATEIEHALETEPRVGAMFAGDFRSERSSLLFNPPVATTPGHDPKDERALELAVVDEIEPLVISACPPKASLAECWKKLPRTPDHLVLAGTTLDNAADALRSANASARQKLQAELTHEVAMNQIGAYQRYVERAAKAVTRLTALQIQIEVARHNTCLLPALLFAPDVLGDAVDLALVGAISVQPPKWAALGRFHDIQGGAAIASPNTALLGGQRRYGDHWEIQCPNVAP